MNRVALFSLLTYQIIRIHYVIMGLVIKSSCFCKTSRIVVAEWLLTSKGRLLGSLWQCMLLWTLWTLQLHYIKKILKYVQISLGWGRVGKLHRRVILTWKIYILLTILWSSCLSFFCYCGSSGVAFVCFSHCFIHCTSAVLCKYI